MHGRKRPHWRDRGAAVDPAGRLADRASNDAGASYVVVDTGFWIFGKKRLIPAGVIERINDDSRQVYVFMTKEQIKNAPDFDDTDRQDHSPYDTYYSAY
jgi:hypothetical protein